MRILFGLVLSLASVSAFAQHECKFSAERRLDIDAAGLKALALDLGSSDAHVKGVAGSRTIEVRGKACASEQEWLKDLNLRQERAGDRATVSTTKTRGMHINLFGSSYAYIDIEVSLPAGLALEVDAGSGDVHASNVAALNFSSGSGDLDADHVAGAVVIKVGSGDVGIDELGSLQVDGVGSGDIRANGVHGDVRVGHVGSGDLTFTDVKGGVRIESIGSGDAIVRHAGSSVEVGSVGSGDITVDGIGGDFVVRAAGSGELRHRNVTGKIDIPSRHMDD